MPYIPKKDREELDDIVKELNAIFEEHGFTGKLNYILFKLALRHCRCYKDYALFLGELQACSLEVYRRQCAGYEELKIESNGDVEE